MQLPIHQPTIADKNKVIESFASVCINFFSVINQITKNQVLHAYPIVVASPYYKHKIKQTSKLLNAAIDALCNEAEWEIGGTNTMYDYFDNSDDAIQININDMRRSLLAYVKKFLDDKDAELWTELELTRILAMESKHAFDDIAKESTIKSGINIAGKFFFYNPHKVAYLADLLEQQVIKQIKHEGPIDLNECKAAKRAYHRFHNKYAQPDFMSKAMRQAQRNNPNEIPCNDNNVQQ